MSIEQAALFGVSNAEARRRKCLLPLSECAYCGQKLDGQPSLDHVLPRSRGGSDGVGNRAPSCRTCDRRKDDRTPQELVEWALRVVEVQQILRERLAEKIASANRLKAVAGSHNCPRPTDNLPGVNADNPHGHRSGSNLD